MRKRAFLSLKLLAEKSCGGEDELLLDLQSGCIAAGIAGVLTK
jgi:hypothetical protein